MIYGIEEAVKCAQRGGVGIVIYYRKVSSLPLCLSFLSPRIDILLPLLLSVLVYRKEELSVKLQSTSSVRLINTEHRVLFRKLTFVRFDLVDNARKRSGDNAADYFRRTEMIVSAFLPALCTEVD